MNRRVTSSPTERAEEMVRRLGIEDPAVASAMRTVPREWFVPSEHAADAYEDEPLPLWGRDATISAPHMVVLQLEALRVAPGHRVLEVGSGSGYLVALLAVLVGPTGSVTGIERQPELVVRSRDALAVANLASYATIVPGDGRLGWPSGAPYDRIVVSCAVPALESAWREQLADGGRIVAPIGPPSVQHLVTLVSGPQGDRSLTGPACRFVPMGRGLSAHI